MNYCHEICELLEIMEGVLQNPPPQKKNPSYGPAAHVFSGDLHVCRRNGVTVQSENVLYFRTKNASMSNYGTYSSHHK